MSEANSRFQSEADLEQLAASPTPFIALFFAIFAIVAIAFGTLAYLGKTFPPAFVIGALIAAVLGVVGAVRHGAWSWFKFLLRNYPAALASGAVVCALGLALTWTFFQIFTGWLPA